MKKNNIHSVKEMIDPSYPDNKVLWINHRMEDGSISVEMIFYLKDPVKYERYKLMLTDVDIHSPSK